MAKRFAERFLGKALEIYGLALFAVKQSFPASLSRIARSI